MSADKAARIPLQAVLLPRASSTVEADEWEKFLEIAGHLSITCMKFLRSSSGDLRANVGKICLVRIVSGS